MKNIIATTAIFSLIFAMTLISANLVFAATPQSNVQKKSDMTALRTTYTAGLKTAASSKKTDKPAFKQTMNDLKTTFKSDKALVLENFRTAKALEEASTTEETTSEVTE